MDELDEALSFPEDKSLSEMMADTEVTEKAPLVQLQEICSFISIDLESLAQSAYEVKILKKSTKLIKNNYTAYCIACYRIFHYYIE